MPDNIEPTPQGAEDEKLEMGHVIQEFAKQYGPHAFGLISLLIIWVAVVQPILEKNQLDFEAQRKVIELLNSSANQQQVILREQERLSENMQDTASILERAAKHTAEGRTSVE